MEVNDRSHYPPAVGILAMELYIPRLFVDQTELELDDISEAVAEGSQPWKPGKYTIGLGQKQMGFVSDREDVYSMCLTVVDRLLHSQNLRPAQIGRLDVGTESQLDKSKSVKSVLMQLFTHEPSPQLKNGGFGDKSNQTEMEDNPHLEGVDSVNACFGGTQALFNAVNWIESSSWDGRLALVVMGDVASYGNRSARPTGGVGAIAILVGPNAPLVFDRGLRAVCMTHCYDFYKPDFHSEFPVVDGQASIRCYLTALKNCYLRYKDLESKLFSSRKLGKCGDDENSIENGSGVALSSHRCSLLDKSSGVVFHTPFCRLVQKSFALLFYLDKSDGGTAGVTDSDLSQLFNTPSFMNSALDKSSQEFAVKTESSLKIARRVGNMYTPAVYGALVSHLIGTPMTEISGKRICLFSYGSGSASALFSLTVADKLGSEAYPKLEVMISQLKCSVDEMLDNRIKLSPPGYKTTLKRRSEIYSKAGWRPEGGLDQISANAYYLVNVDDKFRRYYEKK